MMLTEPINQALLTWIGLGTALLALVVAVVALLRIYQRSEQQLQASRKLEHDLHILSASAVGLGKRLMSLEQTLEQQLHSQQQAQQQQIRQQEQDNRGLADTPMAPAATSQPVAQPSTSAEGAYRANGDTGYSDALQLLQQGIAPAEVARRCGLSKSEVGLIQLMSGKAAAHPAVGED